MSAALMIVHGRLAKEPHGKTNAKGTVMAWSSVALNLDRGGDADAEPLWVNLLAFGDQAAALRRHSKGDVVAVTGPVSTAVHDGQQRITVVLNDIHSTRTVRRGRK